MKSIILVLGVLMLFSCSNKLEQTSEVYNNHSELFEGSVSEITNSISYLNNYFTIKFTDGSFVLTKSIANDIQLKGVLPITRKLLDHYALEINIKHPDVYGYKIKETNGFFNWSETLLVYTKMDEDALIKYFNNSSAHVEKVNKLQGEWFSLILSKSVD